MRRNMAAAGLAAAGALLGGAFLLLTGRDPRMPRLARQSVGRPERRPPDAPGRVRSHKRVRQAGPRQMQDPPEGWDRVDETSDASFPASDPPSTY